MVRHTQAVKPHAEVAQAGHLSCSATTCTGAAAGANLKSASRMGPGESRGLGCTRARHTGLRRVAARPARPALAVRGDRARRESESDSDGLRGSLRRPGTALCRQPIPLGVIATLHCSASCFLMRSSAGAAAIAASPIERPSATEARRFPWPAHGRRWRLRDTAASARRGRTLETVSSLWAPRRVQVSSEAPRRRCLLSAPVMGPRTEALTPKAPRGCDVRRAELRSCAPEALSSFRREGGRMLQLTSPVVGMEHGRTVSLPVSSVPSSRACNPFMAVAPAAFTDQLCPIVSAIWPFSSRVEWLLSINKLRETAKSLFSAEFSAASRWCRLKGHKN